MPSNCFQNHGEKCVLLLPFCLIGLGVFLDWAHRQCLPETDSSMCDLANKLDIGVGIASFGLLFGVILGVIKMLQQNEPIDRKEEPTSSQIMNPDLMEPLLGR